MRTKSFRDLLVWQRSMRLAETVYVATRAFPKEETFGLTSQMRRSAISVPSNIAEGQGRDSDRSFALFLSQARGSLYELETQTELARNLEFLDVDQASALVGEAAEIGRMIHELSGALHSTERSTR